MERLNLERLARLVDEQPTPEERAVLDGDPRLRRELDALRSQTRSLGNLPDMLPPPGGWHQLERKLVSVGLISSPSEPFVWRRWLQVAAILVVFVGGTAIGWVTGRGPDTAGSGGAALPASIDEARLAVENRGGQFRQALQTYHQFRSAQDGSQVTQDPRKRILYLEAVAAAAYLAAEVSPADPFFNELLVEIQTERDRELARFRWH